MSSLPRATGWSRVGRMWRWEPSIHKFQTSGGDPLTPFNSRFISTFASTRVRGNSRERWSIGSRRGTSVLGDQLGSHTLPSCNRHDSPSLGPELTPLYQSTSALVTRRDYRIIGASSLSLVGEGVGVGRDRHVRIFEREHCQFLDLRRLRTDGGIVDSTYPSGLTEVRSTKMNFGRL